jgi:hypothetical protein
MTKLNQVVAAEGGRKKAFDETITNAYHRLQQDTIFKGITRTYTPVDDNDENLPQEKTNVQQTVAEIVSETRSAWQSLIDTTVTKDAANQAARADIMLPTGETVASDVPVTTLLFLEKQMIDVITFIKKMPTLDPSIKWDHDETLDLGQWRSEVVQTTRTKKIPRNHVKAPATDKHPAQVEIFTEDKVVGYWDRLLFSGEISIADRNEMLGRARTLLDAIKFAREEANTMEVANVVMGENLLGYVFS